MDMATVTAMDTAQYQKASYCRILHKEHID